MTYVNRGPRLFLEEKDLRPERRRSEGRLKTYPSSEDVRAWCDVVDDRRRHILELVAKDVEKCKRTLVPPDVMAGALDGGRFGEVAVRRQARSAIRGDKDEKDCKATDRHAREAAEVHALTGTHKIITRSDQPGKIVTKVTGLKPGFKIKPASQDSTRTRTIVQGVQVARPGTSAETQRSSEPIGEAPEKATGKPGEAPGTPKKPSVRLGDETGIPDEAPGKPAGKPGEAPGAAHTAREATSSPVESPTGRPGDATSTPGRPPGTAVADEASVAPKTPFGRPAGPTGSPDKQSDRPVDAASKKDVAVQKPSAIPADDRDHLAAVEAYGGEQDVLLRNLQDDNDGLKRKLEDCLGQLEQLQKVTDVANPAMLTSCKDEIDALEHEIKVMRKGNLSPEEEAEVIKKEVDVLRRYCLKLKTVEDENERLRDESEKMKQKMIAGGGDGLEEKLEVVTRERDDLANKVRKLETELLQYKDLPEDLEVYRDRSKTLDSALAERDELRRRLDRMRGLESEVVELRVKAARLSELERSPQRHRPDVGATELELKKTASRCRCLEQDMKNARAEKEAMARRIECACAEIERLRPLAKEAEIARLERDKLQIKANELAHLQVHNENLMLKCKCLEAAASERDAYKQRYEEMIAMECECDLLRCQAEENKCLLRERDGLKKQIRDLETCIHEQDEEIRRLMCHVEAMAKSKEETQARVRDALATMRAEVEKKDRLIEASEEKLASVQTQLKSSIQGVSCETLCYKTRIEELERELGHLKKSRAAQDRPNEDIRRELAAAKIENEKLQVIAGKMSQLTGDEHLKSTLRQSECAVRKVVEELSRQYNEWDRMSGRRQKGKGCGCAQQREVEIGEGEKT